MSYVKRQLLKRGASKSLDKSSMASPTECRQAAYVMRYGKEWLQQWWKDHPDTCDMTPFSGDPRKIVGTGMNAEILLAQPLELIESDKHPMYVHGYGTVDLDGWIFKAKITAMGGSADHLLNAGGIPVVGTLRESPNGYQFSVREVLTTKPMEA
jgi:hypothetical protein